MSILRQQLKYTIHTSQTADFSEAEEITDSGDNDDRLPWQAVGAEEAPEPQECQQ
jgi:hypothetical protein